MVKQKTKFSLIAIALTLAGGSLLVFTLYRDKGKPSCKDTDVIVVGTNAEFPPFSFIDNNRIVGFDIDIMQEVAKRMGKTIEWRDMPFEALIPDIQLGTIHMIAAGMTPTPERAQRILFTKPYTTENPLVIVSLAQNHITGVADLIGKEVIVNDGFFADEYMQTIPDILLTRLPTTAEAFLALDSNRAYAYVLAKRSAQPLLTKYGANHFNVVAIPDTAETAALAIAQQYPELHREAQKALDTMESDGSLATIKKIWDFND
jgi:ABC-type amino acid transport substrate-binding protein